MRNLLLRTGSGHFLVPSLRIPSPSTPRTPALPQFTSLLCRTLQYQLHQFCLSSARQSASFEAAGCYPDGHLHGLQPDTPRPASGPGGHAVKNIISKPDVSVNQHKKINLQTHLPPPVPPSPPTHTHTSFTSSSSSSSLPTHENGTVR